MRSSTSTYHGYMCCLHRSWKWTLWHIENTEDISENWSMVHTITAGRTTGRRCTRTASSTGRW